MARLISSSQRQKVLDGRAAAAPPVASEVWAVGLPGKELGLPGCIGTRIGERKTYSKDFKRNLPESYLSGGLEQVSIGRDDQP